MLMRHWLVLPAFLLVLNSASAAGQSVRGRIALADAVSPVSGATVSVRDENGSVVRRVVSGGDGTYFVRLPRPGRYKLDAMRIGFQPTSLDLGELTDSSVFVIDVVMVPQARELAPVVVAGRDDCGRSVADGARFLALWNSARVSLERGYRTDKAKAADIRMLLVDGVEDAPLLIRDGSILSRDDLHPEVDSSKARDIYSSRGFATTVADTLALRGYVRRRADGGVVFDAPSADALLSDAFLATHCLRLVSEPRDHPDWIGIGFTPKSDVDTLADIKGTLWLQKATGELRLLDFEYTNLLYVPLKACVTSRVCISPSIIHNAGTGGTLTFAYLRTGDWLVNHWVVRTPGESYQYRKLNHKMLPNGDWCLWGPRCEDVLVPLARLGVNAGAVVTLTSEGVELYRDSATLAAIDRIVERQAGKTPAQIIGQVTDVSGTPLRRVLVTTDAPVRSVITNDSGYFEIRNLPPNTVVLTLRKAGYQPGLFHLALIADSTKRVWYELAATRPGRAKAIKPDRDR